MYTVLCFAFVVSSAIANESRRGSQTQNNNQYEAFDNPAPVLVLDGYQPSRRSWDMNLDNTLMNSLDTNNYLQNIPVSRAQERVGSRSDELQNRRSNWNNALGLKKNAQPVNSLNNANLWNRRKQDNSKSNVNNNVNRRNQANLKYNTLNVNYNNPSSNNFNNVNNVQSRRNWANIRTFNTLNSKYKDFWNANNKLNRRNQAQPVTQNRRSTTINRKLSNNANLVNRRRMQNATYTRRNPQNDWHPSYNLNNHWFVRRNYDTLDSNEYTSNYENRVSNSWDADNFQDWNNPYYRRNLANVNRKAIHSNNNFHSYNSIVNRNYTSRSKRSLNNAGNLNYNGQENYNWWLLNDVAQSRNSLNRRNMINSNLNSLDSYYKNQVPYAVNNANNILYRRQNQANVTLHALRTNESQSTSRRRFGIVDEDTSIELGYDDQTPDYETGDEHNQRKKRSVGKDNPDHRRNHVNLEADKSPSNELYNPLNSVEDYLRDKRSIEEVNDEDLNDDKLNSWNNLSKSNIIYLESDELESNEGPYTSNNVEEYLRKRRDVNKESEESNEYSDSLNSKNNIQSKRSEDIVYNPNIWALHDDLNLWNNVNNLYHRRNLDNDNGLQSGYRGNSQNVINRNKLVSLESDELYEKQSPNYWDSIEGRLRRKRNLNIYYPHNLNNRRYADNFNAKLNNRRSLVNYNDVQLSNRVGSWNSVNQPNKPNLNSNLSDNVNINPNSRKNHENLNNRRNLQNLGSNESNENQSFNSLDTVEDGLWNRRKWYIAYKNNIWTPNKDQAINNNLNNRRNVVYYSTNANNNRNLHNYNSWPLRNGVQIWNSVNRRIVPGLNSSLLGSNYQNNYRRNLLKLESDESDEEKVFNVLNYVDDNKYNNRNYNSWDFDGDIQSSSEKKFLHDRRNMANAWKPYDGDGVKSNIWNSNLKSQELTFINNENNNLNNRRNQVNNARRKHNNKKYLQNAYRTNWSNYNNDEWNLNNRRNNKNNDWQNLANNVNWNLYNGRKLHNRRRLQNVHEQNPDVYVSNNDRNALNYKNNYLLNRRQQWNVNALNNAHNFRNKRSLNRLTSNYDSLLNPTKHRNYINRRSLGNYNEVPSNYAAQQLQSLHRRNSYSLDANVSQEDKFERKVNSRRNQVNSNSGHPYDNQVVNSVYNAKRNVIHRRKLGKPVYDGIGPNKRVRSDSIYLRKQDKNRNKSQHYYSPHNTHLQYESPTSHELNTKQQNRKLRLRLGDKSNNGFKLKLKLNIPADTRSENYRDDNDDDDYMNYFHKGNNINVRRELSNEHNDQDTRRNLAFWNSKVSESNNNQNNRRILVNERNNNQINRRNSANLHSNAQLSNVLNNKRRNLHNLNSLWSNNVARRASSE